MQVKRVDENSNFSAEKLKKNNLFDNPKLFADVYCFEAGQEQKVHDHGESDKLYYVLEGSGTFVVDGERRRFSAGDVILAPAKSVHGVVNESGKRLRCLVVMAPSPNF